MTTNNPLNSLLIANNFLGSINHPTSDTNQLSSFLLLHPEHFTWFYVTNKSII